MSIRVAPRSVLLFLLLLVTFVAAVQPAGVTMEATPTGRFEPGPCTFKGAESFDEGSIKCGYLIVPERHSRPDGTEIKLAVAILKSTGPNPAREPLVMAQGGPGGSTIDTYASLVRNGPLRILLEDRDIVLFDQRGTLYSQPALLCPESITLTEHTIEQQLSREESLKRSVEALQACRDRLAREGVDLAAYNSLENAADIEALRAALGYDRINLYGVSYGTLLALHTMRGYPSALRSVILDAVLPAGTNFLAESPRTHDRALTELFRACSADPGCHAAYSDLEQVTFGLVRSLNERPARVPITDGETGKRYNAVLDGDTFLDLIEQLLYASPLIPLLPAIIYGARAGDFAVLARVWPVLAFDRTQAEGMYFSTTCAEDADFQPEQLSLTGVRPLLAEIEKYSATGFLDVCARWNVPPLSPDANAPVASDISTLVFNGEFDPITPPAFGEEAARTLSHSYVYTFPGLGHGALTDDPCALEIARAFLDNPQATPDARCLVSRPPFTFASPSNTLITPAVGQLLVAIDGGDLRGVILLLLGTLILASTFLIWPLSWLIRWLQNVPRERRTTAVVAPWLAAAEAGLVLAFAGGLGALVLSVVLRGGESSLLIGVPRAWEWIFALPPLIAALAIGMAVLMILAWRGRFWGAWRRVYYTALSAAALVVAASLVATGLMFPLLT